MGKGVRAGRGFGRTAIDTATTLATGPVQAIRHPVRAAKSTGQLADVILNPRTIPVSALESTSSTMRLPVRAFAGYGLTDDLADVARPGVTMFDDEAARVAKAASDDLTAMQIAGETPSVQYGDLYISTTPAPFQKTTGPAMFSTGPGTKPWMLGESRDYVTEEGVSFFSPSYLSRFDARSAFGRQTAPGDIGGAVVIRDPDVIADVLRQSDDLDAAARLAADATSGKTFTPRGPATEVAEFEATLPQPYQKFRDVDKTLRVWSDTNVVKPPADEVADHVATLRELGMNKQADRLLKEGEYSLGELRRLAVIDDPSKPLTALDVYRLKGRAALENLRRLNPNFKAVTITERAGLADDLARQADVLDDAARRADDAARQADDLDDAARAVRGENAEALSRRADDLRTDAARIRREIDDAERAFQGAAERAGEAAGVTRWAQGARGLLTRDTRDDVGRAPQCLAVDASDERTSAAGRGHDPFDTEGRRNPGNPLQARDVAGRFTPDDTGRILVDPFDTEDRRTTPDDDRTTPPGPPTTPPTGTQPPPVRIEPPRGEDPIGGRTTPPPPPREEPPPDVLIRDPGTPPPPERRTPPPPQPEDVPPAIPRRGGPPDEDDGGKRRSEDGRSKPAREVPPTDEAPHAKVVVRQDLVLRELDLETGEETISVREASPLVVTERDSRPHRNRQIASGNRTVTTDQRGRVHEQRKTTRRKLHPFLSRGELRSINGQRRTASRSRRRRPGRARRR